MRSYGKKFAFKKTVQYRERQTRMATEWDVRLDVGDSLLIEDILNNVKRNKDEFQFILCSGIEKPDKQATQGCPTEGQAGPWTGSHNQYGSNGEHVHLCVVLLVPKARADVLAMLRGPRKVLDEYCAPRKQVYSYAGWVIHHAKPDWKIPGEPPIRFEHGTLPMDPVTVEWAIKIDKKLKQWGYDLMHRRFKVYTDLLHKHKTLEKIEGLMMSLDDHDASA